MGDRLTSMVTVAIAAAAVSAARSRPRPNAVSPLLPRLRLRLRPPPRWPAWTTHATDGRRNLRRRPIPSVSPTFPHSCCGRLV